MDDYSSLLDDIPAQDKLSDEDAERLKKIRNELIQFASDCAKKRCEMFNNYNIYAYLSIESMILMEFVTGLFHNRNMVVYESLKKISEENEKKFSGGVQK